MSCIDIPKYSIALCIGDLYRSSEIKVQDFREFIHRHYLIN